MKIGFDNDKYLKIQSEHIKERIGQFGDKLYLEFGGKLFDDYHASRVLPGFKPDSKLQMLMQLSDVAEIVIVISAADIEKNKVRGDLGITYDVDVLRLIGEFEKKGLYVGSVVITQFAGQNGAVQFKERLEKKNIKVYQHYKIEGYPSNIPLIVSEDGFGKNDYIETTRPLVVITAPGPGSGKMATCLSQLYHENKRGVKAGYAKFETFPIWNIPLKHPVNLAYEAATADLNDVNMIDPFHLEAYGETTVNYNRDIEIFPVLNAIFEEIYGENTYYKSPTDMGVNMAGNCIFDDDACCEASNMEIIRRYYTAMNKVARGEASENEVYKIELLMKQAKITTDDRKVTVAAKERAEKLGVPTAAIELEDGTIITSKTSDFLGASAALILNALKYLAGIDHEEKLIQAEAIQPIQDLKVRFLGGKNPRLHTDETLIALALSSATSEKARAAMEQLPKLRGCQVHTSVMLSEIDLKSFKKLGVDLTSEPVRNGLKLY
ncbi:MAG: DUF1846 domain-containing protein [Roseburia sp.]|uniref:DUF1846 domain-containing protein n=1 Tax=Roseburia sp. 831b TaxID=1261635 RepID=UPI0009521942|nr:DUF1846 domain-containing protein [Roseburia sp. 831b]MCI5918377.1 DUF1846 domain-containing protein [Roseburia sp.]MDD6217453.1 DUF1846 domain-containing protein [Roseburia sp.]WVK74486.1 DUF1846 domain-containing protein [Roseburia sp. 831b]